jgi:hypothetical protein
MPKLRGIWSEYEDRWWIRPLPEEQRAKPAEWREAVGV